MSNMETVSLWFVCRIMTSMSSLIPDKIRRDSVIDSEVDKQFERVEMDDLLVVNHRRERIRDSH